MNQLVILRRRSQHSPLTLLIGAAFFVFGTFSSFKSAEAKPKGKPACGANYLPFYKGEIFEYEWLAPETVAESPDQAVRSRGLKADWPVKLVIEVKNITGNNDSATITLSESYRKRTIETKIHCDLNGFRISPQSFFFAGEPGGGIGMTLSNLKQDGPGLPSTRDFSRNIGKVWTSFIKASLTRQPTQGSESPVVTNGKVEIDRQLVIGNKELVTSGLGEHRAYRLTVEISGRAAVEPAMDKWRDLPLGQLTIWLAPGVGLVRVHNRYGHGWQLKSFRFPGDDNKK